MTDALREPAVDAETGSSSDETTLDVAEFFAGIGLARLGLEKAGFRVTWANDIERDKHDMYVGQFGETAKEEYHLGDVTEVKGGDLPEALALAWASFPCTDLSLAGGRGGLAGKHSGTFWQLTRILKELDDARPGVAVLENVNGLATSHKGEDLKAAITAFNQLGYSVDVMTIDARRFVPQSRPRLFVVGVQRDLVRAASAAGLPIRATGTEAGLAELGASHIRPAWLDRFFDADDLDTHQFSFPVPPLRESGFTELVEPIDPNDDRWWDAERMEKFVKELSKVQRSRIDDLTNSAANPIYRTAYRRTRDGKPAWEVRADDIAGCLRTARGGSSKQAVVRIRRGEPLRARWLTPLEYAKLMGADEYELNGARRNQALFGFGDAVCVDVVEWLARNYLHPIIAIASH